MADNSTRKRKVPNTSRLGRNNSNNNGNVLPLAQKVTSISNRNSKTAKRPRTSAKKSTVNFNTIMRNVPNSIPIETIVYADVPFYYIKLDGFKPAEYERGLRAIILDNDETTGFYETLLDYVKTNVTNKNGQTLESVVDELKDILEGTKSLRTGYEEFLLTLMKLKTEGRIDAVIMYTNMGKSASIKIGGKRYNRPQLLAAVFDRIVNREGEHVFDLLIFRDKPYPHPEKYIAVINKIYEVEGKDNKYLFLDDKPEVIYNNNTKVLSPFGYKVNEYKNYKGSSFTNKNAYGKSILEKLDETFPTP
jgi:hypothetical protein